ncbi:right-handed parallel beta-helix repeat-containing protein, partial [uncultured Methanobrevibacter sp.]|uniref:right-handed parallel beta-helix repeat-containing protein n=2 Tax=uncultured Methanobrevibacter sp. TaxID=253161 RepID=UPI00345C4DB4
MQKKYFIAFCLILFIISIAVVSASDIEQTDADTDVLSVSNEYKLSNGVDSGTFDELQKKINNASEGSTIEFFNNYTYDDTFEAKGIMINKSLTIEGNGFTIDGANKARIFFIDATNNITLNNIVFKNAISPEGSAILFNKSIENLTISNSVFSNNLLSEDGHAGGAISFNNHSSDILFENNTFENNYAPLGYGGSIVFDGNTTNVTFNSSTFRVNKPREKDITGVGDAVLISIDNCEFDNITARTGGAIYVEGSFDTSLIHNTKFTNNKAFTDNLDYGGGAIYVEGNASSIHIFNSNFINNTAKTHGGAILFNNSIENITISNSVFSNNIVPNDGHGGGAISFNNDVSGLLFENDTFENNYAPLGYGGSITFYRNTTNVTFNSSTFRVNKPREKDITAGGAIYFVGDAVLISIDNCEFDNITARTGGAIYVEGSFDT